MPEACLENKRLKTVLQCLCFGNQLANSAFLSIFSFFFFFLGGGEVGKQMDCRVVKICYCKNVYGNKAQTGLTGTHRSRLF